MERKTLKQFHNELSWSTRIYTLLVVVTVLLSAVFNAWSTDWTLTIISALAIILFVETFALYFQSHPKTWRVLRVIFLLILLALLFIGTVQ